MDERAPVGASESAGEDVELTAASVSRTLVFSEPFVETASFNKRTYCARVPPTEARISYRSQNLLSKPESPTETTVGNK